MFVVYNMRYIACCSHNSSNLEKFKRDVRKNNTNFTHKSYYYDFQRCYKKHDQLSQ